MNISHLLHSILKSRTSGCTPWSINYAVLVKTLPVSRKFTCATTKRMYTSRHSKQALTTHSAGVKNTTGVLVSLMYLLFQPKFHNGFIEITMRFNAFVIMKLQELDAYFKNHQNSIGAGLIVISSCRKDWFISMLYITSSAQLPMLNQSVYLLVNMFSQAACFEFSHSGQFF